VRSTAQETTTSVCSSASLFDRCGATKTAVPDSCILIQQVSILGAPSLTKVLDLHDFRKDCHIDSRLCSLCKIVSLENFRILCFDLKVDHLHYGEREQTWWKAPLCQYFCRNFCCPLDFSALVLSALSTSSLCRCSSGKALLFSISSRSCSLSSSFSFSFLIRPSSRRRQASNSLEGSRPSVSSTSGTLSSFSIIRDQ